jgi:hypothetical protein
MYKDKKTLFYNGEKLLEGDEDDGDPLIYDLEEQETWEVIIILPGVQVIPEWTFRLCKNVKTVIMADTVKRIEERAFNECDSLKFVELSRNLEYIGNDAFYYCDSLPSIFIPPSCREIGHWAFYGCKCLLILGMPQHIQIGEGVFKKTKLIQKSPIDTDEDGYYDEDDDEAANQWVRTINNDEAYALHRACSSFNPLSEIIHAIVKRQGLVGMRLPNSIGITPSQYLAANMFADISEKEIVSRYISEMMGEVM